MKVKHKKSAYSLAELAVVIVIIGILMTLVIQVNGYIENAKNQSFIYELTSIQNSIDEFYNKYGKLPGDFDQASTNINATLLNGNGNQIYEEKIVSSNKTHESYMVWSHLQKANLVSGVFTGMSESTTEMKSVVGKNILESKIFKGSGYRIGSDISNEILTHPEKYIYKVILEFADYTVQNSTTGRGLNGALKANSLQNIDIKIDDGNPFEGFLFGLNDSRMKCNSSTSNPTSSFYSTGIEYINDKTEGCIMSLILSKY